MTLDTRHPRRTEIQVLALDFDGVICNSADEVFQTALETWSEVIPDSPLSGYMSQQPEIREAFNRLVPLGNRAEDFGVALHIISVGQAVHTQEEYDQVRDRLGALWLDRFHHMFYKTRTRLRNEDPQSWLELHKTYPLFIELLRLYQQKTILAIATAKDGDSVKRLLRHFHIEDLFSNDLILDKETGISKTLHLRALAEQLDCRPSQITFVDDKLNHLVSTAALGVKGVLAGWGHNTPREHLAAKNAGFAVASLESAGAVLFDY